MKKSKVVTVSYSIVWVIIIWLSAYILLKSCVIFSSDTLKQVACHFVKEISEKTIKSSSAVVQYLLNVEEGKELNQLNGWLEAILPMKSYILASTMDSDLTNSTLEVSNNGLVLKYQFWDEEGDQTGQDQSGLEGKVSFIYGEIFDESAFTDPENEGEVDVLRQNQILINTLLKSKDYNYLIKNFYIVDSSTKARTDAFKVNELLTKDMTMEKEEGKPQILIYHTHSQEAFSDSRKGKKEDTIVGVGTELTEILEEVYGYTVIHDTNTYDLIDGKLDRNQAYNEVLPVLKKTIQDNPSIEVVIDLHRDGVADKSKRLTTVDGNEMAQIMFFNGMSYNNNGPIDYLQNPNLTSNLAFSLQLKLKAMVAYPSLVKKIYLKAYEYNLSYMPKSLLIELGTQNNTVQEAKNAMEPLADILNQVLSGE